MVCCNITPIIIRELHILIQLWASVTVNSPIERECDTAGLKIVRK